MAAAGSSRRCNSAGNAHPVSNTGRRVWVVLIAPVGAFMAAAAAAFENSSACAIRRLIVPVQPSKFAQRRRSRGTATSESPPERLEERGLIVNRHGPQRGLRLAAVVVTSILSSALIPAYVSGAAVVDTTEPTDTTQQPDSTSTTTTQPTDSTEPVETSEPLVETPQQPESTEPVETTEPPTSSEPPETAAPPETVGADGVVTAGLHAGGRR